MPRKIKKACRKQGCPATTTDKSGYCNVHIPTNAGWARHQKGLSDTKRGYGWTWRKLRVLVLERDNHLCRHCLAEGRAVAGNQVDHIIPKSQGGNNDMTNLQTLCVQHHNKKTATESSSSI